MIELKILAADTAELHAQLRALLGGQPIAAPASDSQPVPTPAPAARTRKAKTETKGDAGVPEDPPPAGAATEAAGSTPSPTSAPASAPPASPESTPSSGDAAPVDRAKAESDLRAVLGPLMEGAKAVQVTELLARYGGRVSKIPDNQLADALADAKKLAEA